MDYKKVTQCRACGSEELLSYLNLGEHPLANSLLHSQHALVKKYPIEMLYCDDCNLSQLSVVVDPHVIYRDYVYHSSVSETFKKHCREMAKTLRELYDAEGDPLVVDIASNDGCLLEQFKAEGYYVMGVEPSENLVKESEAKGISTIHDFWGKEAADRVPACDFITATNVLAHVDDVKSFVKLAAGKLRAYSKGVMVVEVPYLKNLIFTNQFDTIYHEHLSYFLLKPLLILFSSCGMSIFKVEEYPIHGGSLRVYASPYDRETDGSVLRMLMEEYRAGLYSYRTYEDYADNVATVRHDLQMILNDCRLRGEKVAGFGASAKGISLMNYCGITNIDVSYIADDTPDKQGKYTPGSGIPIVSRDNFDTNHPDYIMLTAWNFSDEMKKKTEKVGARYIVPIPNVRVE